MLNKLLLIFAIFLISFSCKKKETTSPENQNTGTTTGSSVIPNFSGQFLCSKKINVANRIAVDNGFRNDAIILNSTFSQLVSIGDISLNGTVFKFNGLYNDTTTTNQYPVPHIWAVSGKASDPSFGYTDYTPFPVFTGYGVLSDTFDISNGLTIPLIGYSGADEIKVMLVGFDASFNIFSVPEQIYSSNATNIYFSNSELSVLSTCTYIYLSINFHKNNYQNINSKDYNFKTVLTVSSPIQL